MKVGIIAPGGFDKSGQERVIPVFLSLIERLARRGHEVHVFAVNPSFSPDEYRLMGAFIHSVGHPPPGRLRPDRRQVPLSLRAFHRIWGEHRRGPFTALHGLWLGGSTGLTAAVAGRLLRVRSVATLGGGEMASLPDIGYGGQLCRRSRRAVAATLRLADAVTAASEFARQPLLARRPDTRLLPLGVDTSRFAGAPSPPAPGPPFRLLHVASLNRVKDQPTLLRAFQRLRCDAGVDAHLEIIGEDTLGGEIQRLAAQLGIFDRVTFRGFQRSDTVQRALREAHLLLHSSRHESGPVVFLEAAACGVPTVGTAVGHIADLAPEAAAATVPIGDSEALAAAVLGLLQDPDRRIALGRRARLWACRHDADWTAAQFENLYAGRLSGRESRNYGTEDAATAAHCS